jgi:ABC-type nitrate/sulfonate/bicarbonate transport system substrate-binding protein
LRVCGAPRANISRATWLEYYAEKALNTAGLHVADLKMINLPVPAMLSALDQGRLDLVGQNEPWVTHFAQDGNKPVLPPPHLLLPDSQAGITLSLWRAVAGRQC